MDTAKVGPLAVLLRRFRACPACVALSIVLTLLFYTLAQLTVFHSHARPSSSDRSHPCSPFFLAQSPFAVLHDLPHPVSVVKIKVANRFPYAYISSDVDSRIVGTHAGALDPGLTSLFVASNSKCCADGGHFVDVGSHFGYYSMLAFSLGCSFTAVEPVPLFRSILQLNAAINQVGTRGTIVPHAVGNVSRTIDMFVPKDAYFGRARLGRYEHARGTLRRGDEDTVVVEERPLSAVLGDGGGGNRSIICAMKVDVEGHEPSVIAGALSVLRSGAVRTLQLEFSPRYNVDGLAGMLATFHRLGYRMTDAGMHLHRFGERSPLEIGADDLVPAQTSFVDISTDAARQSFIDAKENAVTNIWLTSG